MALFKKRLFFFIPLIFAVFLQLRLVGNIFSADLATPAESQKVEVSSSNIELSSPEIGESGEKLRFDLGDLVRMAMRNNGELRGADYDIEDSRWKLKQAQPRGLPVVEYQYEAAPVPRNATHALESFFSGDITMLNRVKVGLGVPITSFGKIELAQALANQGIEASKEKKNQKASEIVLKIKQLYYGILLAKDLKEMFGDALQKLEGEISKRENSTSPTDPIDLAKIKLTRYELLKRFGEILKKEELAIEGLRIQTGIDRRIGFQITDQHLQPVEFELKNFSYYVDEAKKYRPETKLLKIGLGAKENEYRLEKRNFAPNLGFGAFFELGRTLQQVVQVATDDYNDPFNFSRAGAGIRLSGTLNWKETNSKIHQKEAEYYKMSVTKDYAEQGLTLDLKDSYLTVKQSKNDLDNAESAYRLSRQLVFLTKSNFEVGVGNKNDYADSLQAFLLMKGRYYEAVFNYNVAVATLISKLGYQP